MSKLPVYDDHDALVINHAQLRAPVDMQAECQQQLLNLEGVAQQTGEYLFLRELKVRSSANALATDFHKKLIQQSELAVEANSNDAENAQAVRFKSLGQLLAQLSQHIQAGRSDIWYWQSWQYLFDMPVGDALALLWSDYATDLADMVQVLAEQGNLHAFWSSLSNAQSRVILEAVKRALSVNTGQTLQTVELDNVKHAVSISRSALSIWKGVVDHINSHDERVQLAALVTLLRWRPDYLFNQSAQQSIETLSNQLSRNIYQSLNHPEDTQKTDSNSKVTTISKLNQDKSNDKTNNLNKRVKDIGDTGKSVDIERNMLPESPGKLEEKGASGRLQGEADKSKYTDEILQNSDAPEPLLEVERRYVHTTDDLINRDNAKDLFGTEQFGKHEAAANRNVQAEPMPEVENKINFQPAYTARGAPFCQQGGVFYLLNFMARKNVQALFQQHNAYEILNGPWGCLYRLADLLERKEDAALDQFFAYRMGLDSAEELKQLPSLSHAEQYYQYAEKLYGALVWNPQLLSIPAQIEYTPSHLDIHYPLDKVNLDVRRVALDINPGWLPWLGQVVSFHYHDELKDDGVQH